MGYLADSQKQVKRKTIEVLQQLITDIKKNKAAVSQLSVYHDIRHICTESLPPIEPIFTGNETVTLDIFRHPPKKVKRHAKL